MGIPTSFSDRIEERIIWRKSVVQNDDGMTPIRTLGAGEVFNNTFIVSNLDFDFTERIYNIQYFGIMDVMSTLGGLRASIVPIIGYLVPLLTLHFLYSLAGIIDDKMEANQQTEMIHLIVIGRKQFKLVKAAHEHGQVILTPENEQ